MRTAFLLACVLALGCSERASPRVEPSEPARPTRATSSPEPPPPEPSDPRALHQAALRERDPSRAAIMLERACDEGFAASCIDLADMLEAGEGIAADPGRARGVLERACESGSTAACDRLGH